MKTHIILSLLVFGSLIPLVKSQILNQDAKGISTILAKGGTVGFDIKDASVRMNYYQMPFASEGWVIGADLQGANSDGIATLFTNDGITPEGRGSLAIGYKIDASKFADKDVKEKEALLEDSLNSLDSILTLADSAYQIYYEAQIKSVITDNTCPLQSRDVTVEKLISILPTIYQADTIKKRAKEWEKKAKELCFACDSLIAQIGRLADALSQDPCRAEIQQILHIEYQINRIGEELENLPTESFKRIVFIPYLRASANGTEFTHDFGADSTTFDSRFVDTLRAQLSIEAGLSMDHDLWRAGITLGLMRFDNFSELKKRTYKYTEVDSTMSTGSLSKGKEITAYSGSFERFGQVVLNWDLMRLLRTVDDTMYVGLSLYGRTSVPLVNSDNVPKPNTILGIGVNYLNIKTGKFLGGTYLQTSDLFGNSGKPFYRKLQFGLMARIAFSGIDIKKIEK
jgi:hypothetical protein